MEYQRSYLSAMSITANHTRETMESDSNRKRRQIKTKQMETKQTSQPKKKPWRMSRNDTT